MSVHSIGCNDNIHAIPGVLCLCYRFNRLATEQAYTVPSLLATCSCLCLGFMCMMEPIFSSIYIESQPEASVMDESVIHTCTYIHVHTYMYIHTNIPKFIVTQLFASLPTQQLSTLIIWLLSNLLPIRIHTTSSSNTYTCVQDPCIIIWYISI